VVSWWWGGAHVNVTTKLHVSVHKYGDKMKFSYKMENSLKAVNNDVTFLQLIAKLIDECTLLKAAELTSRAAGGRYSPNGN